MLGVLKTGPFYKCVGLKLKKDTVLHRNGQENDHLGAMTWLCYNQNCIIMSSVIKRQCRNIILIKPVTSKQQRC